MVAIECNRRIIRLPGISNTGILIEGKPCVSNVKIGPVFPFYNGLKTYDLAIKCKRLFNVFYRNGNVIYPIDHVYSHT
jgi:hypothetical protein